MGNLMMQKFFRLLFIGFALFFASLAFAENDGTRCSERNLAGIDMNADIKYLDEIKSKIKSKEGVDSLDLFQLLFVEKHKEKLRSKLNSGFDINSCGGPFDSSLLGLAAALGEMDDVKTIIEYGANLEFPKGSGGQSALISAISSNSYEAANYLIRKGADMKTTYGKYEDGVLHALARSPADKRRNETEELDLARKFMASGVSPDKKNKDPLLDVTPLMLAIIYYKPSLVELFVECGADPYIKDQKGRDSFEFARTRRDKIIGEKMLNILQSRHASSSCTRAHGLGKSTD